jgi:hypothetical protein
MLCRPRINPRHSQLFIAYATNNWLIAICRRPSRFLPCIGPMNPRADSSSAGIPAGGIPPLATRRQGCRRSQIHGSIRCMRNLRNFRLLIMSHIFLPRQHLREMPLHRHPRGISGEKPSKRRIASSCEASTVSTVGRRIETEACPPRLKLTVRFWRFAAVF